MKRKIFKELQKILKTERNQFTVANKVYELAIANKNSLTEKDVIVLLSTLKGLRNEDGYCLGGEKLVQCAKNIPNVNIQELQEFLLKDDIYDKNRHLLEFAKCVPGANIKSIQDFIIKNGGVDDLIHLSKIEGVDNYKAIEDRVVQIAESYIVKTKERLGYGDWNDPTTIAVKRTLFYYARYGKNANVEKFQNLVMQYWKEFYTKGGFPIRTYGGDTLSDFAAEVKGADLNALFDTAAEVKCFPAMFEIFKCDIRNEEMLKKLQEQVMQNVDEKPELLGAVASLYNSKQLKLDAEVVDKIFATGNVSYIVKLFVEKSENVDLSKRVVNYLESHIDTVKESDELISCAHVLKTANSKAFDRLKVLVCQEKCWEFIVGFAYSLEIYLNDEQLTKAMIQAVKGNNSQGGYDVSRAMIQLSNMVFVQQEKALDFYKMFVDAFIQSGNLKNMKEFRDRFDWVKEKDLKPLNKAIRKAENEDDENENE